MDEERREVLVQLQECLSCKLCRRVFKDPYQLMNCLHSFCHDCISIYLLKHDSCPVCKVYTQPRDVKKNYFMSEVAEGFVKIQDALIEVDQEVILHRVSLPPTELETGTGMEEDLIREEEEEINLTEEHDREEKGIDGQDDIDQAGATYTEEEDKAGPIAIEGTIQEPVEEKEEEQSERVVIVDSMNPVEEDIMFSPMVFSLQTSTPSTELQLAQPSPEGLEPPSTARLWEGVTEGGAVSYESPVNVPRSTGGRPWLARSDFHKREESDVSSVEPPTEIVERAATKISNSQLLSSGGASTVLVHKAISRLNAANSPLVAVNLNKDADTKGVKVTKFPTKVIPSSIPESPAIDDSSQHDVESSSIKYGSNSIPQSLLYSLPPIFREYGFGDSDNEEEQQTNMQLKPSQGEKQSEAIIVETTDPCDAAKDRITPNPTPPTIPVVDRHPHIVIMPKKDFQWAHTKELLLECQKNVFPLTFGFEVNLPPYEPTHLIVSVDENNKCQLSHRYILCLLSGCWIVSPSWLEDCVAADKHVLEEPYEVQAELPDTPIGEIVSGSARARLAVKGILDPLFAHSVFKIKPLDKSVLKENVNFLQLIVAFGQGTWHDELKEFDFQPGKNYFIIDDGPCDPELTLDKRITILTTKNLKHIAARYRF